MTEPLFLIFIAVSVLSITTIYVTESVRIALLFLLGLYLIVFFQLIRVWPVGLSIVVLITGLLIVLIINTYCSGLVILVDAPRNILDIFLVVFAGVIAFAFAPQLRSFLNAPLQILISGVFLLTVGLLQTGVSTHPFRVLVSVFIMILGFLLIYAPLEGSALIMALFAFIQITLAFVLSRMIMQSKERKA